jgi:membrane fusion protein (multidrug efflux system)
MSNIKRIAIGAVLVVALAIGSYLYWHHATLYPSTDDAYVQAHVVTIAPQVSGQVDQVRVRNQQAVAAGQTLFTLDRAPFEYAVEQAQSALTQAQTSLGEDHAAVTATEAAVNAAQVKLENAARTAKRAERLRHRGYASEQNYDDAEAAKRAAAAELKVAKANLAEARIRAGTSTTDSAAIRKAKAELKQAQWNLGHTTIKASCSGHVANVTLRPGDAVQDGVSPFKLVCDKEWWVDANYKETDLERIRPGQAATIKVDMYPGHVFKGKVLAINPASGAAFSLLPPENATGNWVKVTQRVPVRVEILGADPNPDYPLRVGTSATVTIDTRTLSH